MIKIETEIDENEILNVVKESVIDDNFNYFIEELVKSFFEKIEPEEFLKIILKSESLKERLEDGLLEEFWENFESEEFDEDIKKEFGGFFDKEVKNFKKKLKEKKEKIIKIINGE